MFAALDMYLSGQVHLAGSIIANEKIIIEQIKMNHQCGTYKKITIPALDSK
jgi:hypothetical protein